MGRHFPFSRYSACSLRWIPVRPLISVRFPSGDTTIILPFAAVLQRRISCVFSERLSEIAAAPQTAGMADVCYGFAGFCKHPARHLQPDACQIFRGSHVQAALEDSVTFPLTEKGGLCQIPDGDFFSKMIMYIDHHCLDLIIGLSVRSCFLMY